MFLAQNLHRFHLLCIQSNSYYNSKARNPKISANKWQRHIFASAAIAEKPLSVYFSGHISDPPCTMKHTIFKQDTERGIKTKRVPFPLKIGRMYSYAFSVSIWHLCICARSETAQGHWDGTEVGDWVCQLLMQKRAVT